MNNIQKIKVYNRVARPSPLYFSLIIILNMCMYGLDIYFAVPSATVITNMTIGNYDLAIKWLIICFAVIAGQYIVHTIIHQIYYLSLKDIYRKVYGRLYDKVVAADEKSFNDLSKDKIVNIAYGSISALEDFPYYFARYLCHFIQVIISVVLLLQNNIIIGAATIVACVMLFFIQNLFNKKRAIHRADYFKYQDEAMEVMADTYSNHDLTQDLGIESKMNTLFLSNISKSQSSNVKMGKYVSLADNGVPLLCKAIVYAVCMYMIFLTRANIFTLTLYLILTKYLTSALTKMSSAQYVLTYVNNCYVAAMRFKTIFDMPQEDLIEYGNNQTDNINGEIIFSNASYTAKNDDQTASISKFNLTIKKNSCVVFHGAHKCGKRAIFHMLTRSIKPTTGTITIDGINIYDFDRKTYSHNVAYTTSKPYFYNDSIMNNMLVTGASKKDIYDACKLVGIHHKIIASTNSYETNLSVEPIFSNFDEYLLGLARAIASKSEIIAIYEFPAGLSNGQKDTLKDLFKQLSKNHTLLVFTAGEWAKEIADKLYKIEKGTISK